MSSCCPLARSISIISGVCFSNLALLNNLLLSLSFQTMLANNSKSVAVSGGHIPSYNSNRWAILTGVPLSMSLSICPSVSPVCLMSVQQHSGFALTKYCFVFLSPHIIIFINKLLQSCSVWLSSCFFFLPFTAFFYVNKGL